MSDEKAPGKAPSTNLEDYPGEEPKQTTGAASLTGGVWWEKRPQNIYVNTNTMAGVMGASDRTSTVYNQILPQSKLEGAWFELSPGEQALYSTIAQSLGASNTGPGTLARFAAMSAKGVDEGVRRTPTQLAWEYAVNNGLVSDDGSFVVADTGTAQRYGSGPSAPPYIDASAARRAMDTVSSSLLGRTLSDKEFDKYYAGYQGRATENPRLDYQQDMTEAVRSEDGYQEYQVATKFATALKSVMRGAW